MTMTFARNHYTFILGATLIAFVCSGIFVNGDVLAGNLSGTSMTFENPLQQNSVEGVLVQILTTLQGIVAVLALVFLVIGAIIYITSAGDQGRVTLAKAAIFAAIIGLALAIAAPALLREIYTALGGTAPSNTPMALTLQEIALNVLQVLLSIVGLLAIIMLVVGGIMYMTSAGDETSAGTAKKTITYAIIGLVVALVSLVIVVQIDSFFQ